MLAFTHSIIIYLLLMISLTVVIFRWNILWYFIWLPIKIPRNLYILYCILRPCYPALLWHHKLIQWHNDYLNWRLVFLLNLKIIFLTTSLYHIASIFAILNNNNNMYYFIREGSSLCTIIFTQNKKGTRRETCFHRMKDVLPLFIRLSHKLCYYFRVRYVLYILTLYHVTSDSTSVVRLHVKKGHVRVNHYSRLFCV